MDDNIIDYTIQDFAKYVEISVNHRYLEFDHFFETLLDYLFAKYAAPSSD